VTKYIAIDTETTGIGAKTHRLIEVAALEFDANSGEPTGRFFHTYINPERDIPPEATAVHGKTLDDLKDAPRFAEVADSLLSFIKGGTLVIHNAPFDVGFLDEELKRAGKPAFDQLGLEVVDTCALSKRYIPAKRHSLDALCERYGVDRSKRSLHGALVDCELLARVYPKLQQEAKKTLQGLNSLLPFALGEAFKPEDLNEVAYRYFALDELKKIIEAEQRRYSEAIREQAQGKNLEGDFFTVTFQNRKTTDWERVIKDHLPDLDLSPYQKQSSAMYIRRR
jgi:DNA polymerase-3 subunit epsilon